MAKMAKIEKMAFLADFKNSALKNTTLTKKEKKGLISLIK